MYWNYRVIKRFHPHDKAVRKALAKLRGNEDLVQGEYTYTIESVYYEGHTDKITAWTNDGQPTSGSEPYACVLDHTYKMEALQKPILEETREKGSLSVLVEADGKDHQAFAAALEEYGLAQIANGNIGISSRTDFAPDQK